MHSSAPALVLCCVGAVLLAGCNRHKAPAAEPAATTRNAPAAAHLPAPASTTHAAAARPAPAGTAARSAAPASAATPAAASTAFQVSGLTLGSAIDPGYAVTAPATRFAADTPILYASVATTGRTAKAMLGARWRYLEGGGVLVNELSQTIVADGPAVTTFKVQNPDRWPAGKYSVEITLDGKPVAKQGFEVTDGKNAK